MLKSHQKVTDTSSALKRASHQSPMVIIQVLHHLRLGYMIASTAHHGLTKC